MTQPSPVLVGAGHLLQRADDPHVTAEPLAMMGTALEQAAADAVAPQLLQRATSIYVPRGMWRYGDPGRAIARRLGAAITETVGTPYGGNFEQACAKLTPYGVPTLSQDAAPKRRAIVRPGSP